MNIPNDFAQVNLIFAGDGCPLGAECTFGVSVASFGGGPTEAANEVIAQVDGNNLMDNLSDDIRLDRVLVKFGPNETGPSDEVSAGLGGGVSGECSAPNTTFLIRKITASGGRAGRGRMFLPGVAESAVTLGGNVVSPFASDNTSAWNAFRIDMNLADLPIVLLHGDGSPISTPTEVTSFLCDSKVATQRRRLRK